MSERGKDALAAVIVLAVLALVAVGAVMVLAAPWVMLADGDERWWGAALGIYGGIALGIGLVWALERR